ncbi:uracil-DNA glycosylase family protein [Mesorhizobium sp. BR1-1-16]|uniref:uracil-DNA glycosylase family protein n=1 Tax=Mesorhizobium sp. BR1-1-16 TaxID=2876653 RepID=UPI001CC9CDBD|nr:uracil-DNA glycosylase family protein [Mesorhizobium sp. BR1-1-16]
MASFDDIATRARACRLCVTAPRGAPLPHEPRPVIRGSAEARILIAGQAPGTRVHASGVPFDDRSGERLRDWMGVDTDTFYDEGFIAILPMGFCFPGLDAKGGDRPPRRECAPAWRAPLVAVLPAVKLVLAIGGAAQRWHLGPEADGGVDDTVRRWRTIVASATAPTVFPLPHPSWRNTGWLKRNPWFETELLPELRARILDQLGRLDRSTR